MGFKKPSPVVSVRCVPDAAAFLYVVTLLRQKRIHFHARLLEDGAQRPFRHVAGQASPSGIDDQRIVEGLPCQRQPHVGRFLGLRLDQLLGHIARDLDGLLNSAALSDEALHVIGRGEIDTFRQLSMCRLTILSIRFSL